MAHSRIIRFVERRIALGCRRVDYRAHARDAVSRKAAQLCMRAHCGFVWRDIDAIDFVVGDETLKPLDLRPHVLQDTTGLLRDRLQVLLWPLAGTGELTLDHELGHHPLLLLVRAHVCATRAPSAL